MWPVLVCALGALQIVQASSLGRSGHTFQSPVSNIELLVPISLSHLKDHRVELPRDDEDDIDREEPYSSIPAYAFTLDTDAQSSSSGADDSIFDLTRSLLGSSSSLYLGSIWKKLQKVGKERDRVQNRASDLNTFHKLNTPKKDDKKKTCFALANQHSGSTREVLLYLCSELVTLLASRCNCTGQEHWAKEKKSSYSHTMPWFGPVGLRDSHQNIYINDDSVNSLGSRVSV